MIASGANGVKGGNGRGNKKTLGADLPQGFLEASSRAPRSRDIAAAAVGVSPKLVQNAKAVVDVVFEGGSLDSPTLSIFWLIKRPFN